jgi:hypothetical protein
MSGMMGLKYEVMNYLRRTTAIIYVPGEGGEFHHKHHLRPRHLESFVAEFKDGTNDVAIKYMRP